MCFNFSGYAHKYQIFIYVLILFITLVSHFKRWIGDFFLCFPLNTTKNSGYIHNKQKNTHGQRDDLLGKGTCNHAWNTEFNTQKPHGAKRKPVSSELHMYGDTHRIPKQIHKK